MDASSVAWALSVRALGGVCMHVQATGSHRGEGTSLCLRSLESTCWENIRNSKIIKHTV